METEKASSKKTIINYGVLLGIATVLMGVLMYLTNSLYEVNWFFVAIGFVLPIAILVLGIKAYKKNNNGFLKLSDAIKIGIGIALISGLIGVVWEQVLTTVLEPDFISTTIEKQKEIYDNSGVSEAQIEAGIQMTKKLSQPAFAIPLSLIKSIFVGFIISLIAGLVMKKEQELY